MKKEVKESNTTLDTKGPMGPGKKKSKTNPSKPFGEEDLFENFVADSVMNEDDFQEVVRKKGDLWILYDDETGVQVGSFNDRDTAWKKQRQYRSQKQALRKHKEIEKRNQKHSGTPNTERKPESRSENLRKLEKFISSALNENFLSYVFEQSPDSDEALNWENFVSKLSEEVVMSDNKLKNLILTLEKSKAKLLSKAMSSVKSVLEQAGNFKVGKSQLVKNPEENQPQVNFEVELKDNKIKLLFSIRIENGRPLLLIPEEARAKLNSLGNEETKLLRAELMHAQETELDGMDDTVRAASKRDAYLKTLEAKIDKVVNNLNLLELAILKNLIKMKYKGIR